MKTCFFLFCLFSFLRLEAIIDPCTPCDCRGGFAIQGEIILFTAVTEQTAFTYSLPTLGTATSVDGEKITNDPSYRPGFRVEGDWLFCDCASSLQLRYVHLYNKHHKHVSGVIAGTLYSPGVSPSPLGFFGTASSRVTTLYNAGDLVGMRYLFNCPDFDFTFLAGVHLANIRYRENVDAGGTLAPTFSWRSRFWGVGPEAGFIFHVPFPCLRCLTFTGDIRGMLLAGRSQSKLATTSLATLRAFNFRSNPGIWGAIPAFDGRLGLDYAWGYACLHINFEAGYEMIWYRRPLFKYIFSTSDSSATIDQYSDVSLHGPYGALRIGF